MTPFEASRHGLAGLVPTVRARLQTAGIEPVTDSMSQSTRDFLVAELELSRSIVCHIGLHAGQRRDLHHLPRRIAAEPPSVSLI